ncbi:uncharacterized protein FIBRA_03220 [Fibroporia radiculosa]|uniref:Cation/H+ exchanger transmembrane domain-containing protein n=1 Tax=Fibroporia radiculosa TaxID=599839 RepID=J4HVV5_9APHY|nr:uncharacterized protein FIBRA_03220 [Fibroporia radiculosa]CCM01172.1 predicted protein [Fibroporia radiculosa]
MPRFHMIDVTTPHIIYAALGGFVVIFGMLSLLIREKLYIGEACLAFLFGVVIGPYGANIFNPREWGGDDVATSNTIVLEFTRVVLAIGVFAIGVELPKAYMAKHWKSLFFLLFPVMTWGWFVSAGLIYALIPGLNFLSSLAVAACLTPTDPILAAAVVGGKYADKHVPAHLRHLLAAESGCNDGAAFPFLFIALYLTIDPTTGRAVSDWFLLLWLYQVVLGIVFGAVLGYAFRHLMKFCERKDLIDRQSYVAMYVSLAMLTIGANTLLGSDDLLAAFSCGTAFAWDGFFNKQTEQSVFSSVIDLLFNIAAFVFVGAWMPFDTFSDTALTLSVWRLIVIAILVLLLRRLPVMIALYRWIPDVKTFREAIFSGHFGPMGAIFISTLAAEQLPNPASPPENQAQYLAATIQPIVAFMVLCSITIHGLSIPFFSLGRRVHSVSRTWSRHDTFGTFSGRSLPEWTTHTRPVIPGQDIIINRDSEMERGTLPPNEKESRSDEFEMRESSTTQDEKEEGSSASRSQEEAARRPDGTDIRDENLPDGSEVIQEWQEGPHRIIERRIGPGNEVEVEVQRNVNGPQETMSDTIRIAEGAAAHVIKDIKHRLMRAPHDVEAFMTQAETSIQHEAEGVRDKIKSVEFETQQKARQVLGSQIEDEEGWLSDASNGEQGTSASAVEGKRSARRQSKSPPKSSAQRQGQSGSRRRMSVRRHLPRAFMRTRSTDVSSMQCGDAEDHGDDYGYEAGTEAPDDRQGRRLINEPPTLPSSLRQSRLQHARIDSIRSIDMRGLGSREQSPTRSVRFADQRNGWSTPRTPLSPSSPATPQPGSEAPSDEEGDSPRNQVRFSLPDLNEQRG